MFLLNSGVCALVSKVEIRRIVLQHTVLVRVYSISQYPLQMSCKRIHQCTLPVQMSIQINRLFLQCDLACAAQQQLDTLNIITYVCITL